MVVNSKSKLKLDWATYEAAKYSVMNWHYSRAMPSGKLVKIGVWENKKFIGTVIYGLGANMNLSKIIGLKCTEVCELVRVALDRHESPVTRIISISLSMLRKLCPGLKAVISYADKDQGHDGIIYRAGNWQHIGYATDEHYLINGIKKHPRTIGAKYGTRSLVWLKKNVDPNVKTIKTKGKHRFVYYLDRRIKHKSNAFPDQGKEGGAIPTDTLQSHKTT